MSDAVADHVELAKKLLSNLREAAVHKVAPLLDDRVVMELPYAPEGVPKIVRGRAAVMESLGFIDRAFKHFRINVDECYECRERGMVILEATSVGVSLQPAPVYQNRYVFVFTFGNGLITSWKEFFNPYPVIWSQAAARSKSCSSV